MNKKTYKIYAWNNEKQDNEVVYTTPDVKDALMEAGEIADLRDGVYYVVIFENDIPVDEYTLNDFIKKISPFNERDLSPAEAEIIERMDRAELRTAVRSCPTEIILQELATRCTWMENKINQIYDIMMQ